MDAIALSRLQFALTAGFHWLFVPLTLGLIILVAIMETMYVRTGDRMYLRMTKFWGKLFLINFAVGVVTGITLEFQFGMNWAEYSKYVGDIFGAPLAIEATVAFFLESTFLGVWIFGWKKVSKKVHLFAVWMVALGSNLSALWILVANAWMQHPVGYELKNGRAEMVDFGALIFSPYAWTKFFHAVSSGWVVASFFVMGISAYHLLRKNEMMFFKKSIKYGAAFGLAATLFLAFIGDSSGIEVAKHQPAKFAAMEALWETQKGAPEYILAVPDVKNERNALEIIPIPKLASFLAFHDWNAEVIGLKDFAPDMRPPVVLTFLSFRFMVGLGTFFILVTLMALIYYKKKSIENKRWFLKLLVLCIPLPYIAGELGWIVAEVGRQPWIVYGLMKTSDAVSVNLTPGHVIFSLVGFVSFYSLLGIIDFYLLVKYSKKGPEKALEA
ncbi:cytochrome bd ubiquinol oxidase subunit I [Denitrovibrio acetiphilus DSM 12809]|uniref:Cytochrome bd ubiquinol oxidase subunit I n=1 Tax=Denitrovibrio acetiphilus (strain DSM 12809 / NBRC 114555 / N2460) TaxID=522772 RepID=D4H214_DENA2|nr:cytochrome ubiquinol oxidase subunit I [Denitrovibrio acetiphilus]ADD66991.1 cytochrome bd ubiquinol oxidase subunit I [Denitrovibrio acetiphilus DSM 12809]